MTKVKRAHVDGKYEVFFYEDKRGHKPTKEYLLDLMEHANVKDNRIRAEQIHTCIDVLVQTGKAIKEPYGSYLRGEIWELKPSSDRMLFAAWVGNKFIILHHFAKKTGKAPPSEIEQAERNLADYKKRHKES